MVCHRVALLTCGVIFTASTAGAQNTTLATSLATAPGQVRTVAAAAGTSYYYNYYLQANRSYAAVCWDEGVKGTSSNSAMYVRCTTTIRDTTDTDVGVSLSYWAEPTSAGGTWWTYTTTAAGEYFVRAYRELGSSGTMRVVLVETTLYSPWFFVSPSGGYESYVEIKNTTTRMVNVAVRALGAGGAQVGTKVTRAISAGGNTYVTVGGNIGATGSGGIEITHDGTPGAIVANVTTLGSTTGLSFDAPCQPRMQWSLIH